MAWHVLTSTYFDLERFRSDRRNDLTPEHLVTMIAGDLEATLHLPLESTAGRPALRDRFGALFYGRPHNWELARRVKKTMVPGDQVYATGDDAGVPLALLCVLSGSRSIPVATNMTDPARFRSRAIGCFLSLALDRFLVLLPTQTQVNEVRKSRGWRRSIAVSIDSQTDTRFFRPSDDVKLAKERPLIVSCGAEQRDYQVLADALGTEDVDVRVCLASPNLNAKTRITIPDPIPSNFEIRHYSFADLRQLYQTADVVVVPLLENRYSAGLTTILEAAACGAPVIATDSAGLIGSMINRGLLVGVPPANSVALREAVLDDLANPVRATERARNARHTVVDELSSTRYRMRLERLLRSLIGDTPVPLGDVEATAV